MTTRRRPARVLLALLRHAALLSAGLVVTAPLLWLAGATLRPRDEFYDHDFFPPIGRWSLDNYRALFDQLPYGTYILNSIAVAGLTVVFQLILASLGGFALAKYHFRGKAALMLVMLSTLVIPPEVLLASQYQLIQSMGLVDTTAGLVLPTAVSVFGVFLFRQSMRAIPDELLQAARIDGSSELMIWWRIALPLSRPMIGAFCLIAFMASWNAFVWPAIVLHRETMFTLPLGISRMLGVYREDYGAMMAATFIAILPVVALFFALQREFISGLTAGAVKG